MSSAPAARSVADQAWEVGIERHLGRDRTQRGLVPLDHGPLVEDALPAADLAPLVLVVQFEPLGRAGPGQQVHADVGGADGAVEVEEHGGVREIQVEPLHRGEVSRDPPPRRVRMSPRHADRERGLPMSSDDHVKTVQSVYEAFGRGDIPTVLDAVTDDVDWATEAGSTDAPWWGPHAGKRRGAPSSSSSSPRPWKWTSSRRW